MVAGVDFDQTISGTLLHSSVRGLFAYACARDVTLGVLMMLRHTYRGIAFMGKSFTAFCPIVTSNMIPKAVR